MQEDPFWGDGLVREPLEAVARRASELIAALWARPEKHIAVAAHSTILVRRLFKTSILVRGYICKLAVVNAPPIPGGAPKLGPRGGWQSRNGRKLVWDGRNEDIHA